MSKCLILFRHAKSSWKEDLDDHERPLSGRGRTAAPLMGAWLRDQGLVPDLALVSTAKRAQQTWALAGLQLGAPIAQVDTRAIYEAVTSEILATIKAIESAVETLIVVGHNPGFEDLATLLMKDDGGDAGMRLREKFPTGAIAVLSSDTQNWADLATGSAMLETFVSPKSIG